jgi:hypothetical protein
MKRRFIRWGACAAVVAALAAMAPAGADSEREDRRIKRVRAHLTGYSEVASATNVGAISTAGVGTFRAEIDEASRLISYTLKFTGLTGQVTQAHLHFGQHHTTGGISVWLCSTTSNPPPDGQQPPVCMADVTLSGTILPTNVIGPATQGIAAGEFEELVAAIRAGVVYANVHTSAFPAGEIRGQLF